MRRPESANFEFLRKRSAQLHRLAALAEHYFPTDPNTCLIKLRQFAELLAQDAGARASLEPLREEPFSDFLRRLSFSGYAPARAMELFHHLRRVGNDAAHTGREDFSAALSALKIARELATWYVRAFGGEPKFAPGPFTPPTAPPDPSQALNDELTRLRAEADAHRTAAELERQRAEAAEAARLTAQERAQREAGERALWQRLAEESEAASTEVRAQLAQLQEQSTALPLAERAALEQQASDAADSINLDEAATRSLIDAQLRQAGWEADAQTLRHAAGGRPVKGRNLAIAEWPTKSGPADYALFAGLKLVGVVEAKRKNKNVMEVLPQAERYSRGITLDAEHLAEGAPWDEFRAPFIFSTNGRPYLRQLETLSGIWRRDVRRKTNPASPLQAWPTPVGLLDQLQVDKDAAAADLKARAFDFGFPLRPYQKRAIEAVEKALEEEQRTMLLAMATGTGKTKLAIAMLYRLIAAKRFRRVCFVVDRSALGDQTEIEFTTTNVVSGRAFADIFGLKGLEDIETDAETRLHICTIQGLVKRILYANDPADVPPVDQYDLMVVDECHRGYLLDREMSDAELSFRSQDDYISKYRRVLDWFDATKIGLTATPALHTVDIFGKPVFTYSYREAVVDGFLVDQEPPIRITTKLARDGIHFVAEESVEFIHAPTGQVELFKLPDAIDFEVEQFNKTVVTQDFNRAIAEELTHHIDPTEKDKTLVFAVSDAHADILVKELRDAFRAAYGDIEDAAIRKVTGSVDKVGKLILAYRNDDLPTIAVTVDLLTTGIDVPRITNLVFVRRVNSRILYDQMIGRATRLCPEIGKESYRIFDAVDLYTHLQHLTDMRPVAADPKITFEHLFAELAAAQDAEHRADVRDQILVRLSRRLKGMPPEARAQFEKEAGETPEDALKRLRAGDASTLTAWAKDRPRIGHILDWTTDGGTPALVPISMHKDEVVDTARGYGASGERPEDFLDAFAKFVTTNLNHMAALQAVVNHPRDLTRAGLRQLRLELDAEGFTDAKLRRAWADAKNVDIAASIIGYVRQAAIGDPLIPYGERVSRAVGAVLARGSWTPVQQRWLHRIGDQLQREIVVDRESLDEEPFRGDGGFAAIDRRFGGKLDAVLADIREEIWRKA
ncbi:MAG: type I restriction-modification system endonuclease [Hyphomonadaceae bacterium]